MDPGVLRSRTTPIGGSNRAGRPLKACAGSGRVERPHKSRGWVPA